MNSFRNYVKITIALWMWWVQFWYELAKTMAEEKALEYSKSSGLDVVSVCPALVFGPMLQSTISGSSLVLLEFLKGLQ